MKENEKMLDIGCRSGNYSSEASSHNVQDIAGDSSIGMLTAIDRSVYRVQLDVQYLPFLSGTTDVVLTNHMLYHVPNLSIALSEIIRVLKKGGRLIAATNSISSMLGIWSLVQQSFTSLGKELSNSDDNSSIVSTFRLENGQEILENYIPLVERFVLNSTLVIRTTQPLLDYLNSSKDIYLPRLQSPLDWFDITHEINSRIEQSITAKGEFRVTKKAGVFVGHMAS